MEHPGWRNHLPFLFFSSSWPFLLTPLPSLLLDRWKCPQMSPQLPAVPPGCRSGDYQRTWLTTAWGIRLNPVNVFILKKRCTFNRKTLGFGFFFFAFLFCLHFFCKKKKN